jgi:spermidine/putrescine ABC transporter ATP-binding subunit
LPSKSFALRAALPPSRPEDLRVAFLEISDLTKVYGEKVVLDKLNISVQDGEFISILGPSGCGKTTALRLIAGFLQPDAGSIAINGREITNLPAHRRNIGMVFQSYALFPHMTVGQNIAFGLEQRRFSRGEISKALDESLDMVRLNGFASRRPAELSGGQQQRVALARALVFKPQLLLLDESLSALDKKLRVQMQLELRQIQKEVGVTAVFVTHDHEEALTMSDRVAVMRNGTIVQLDTPSNVYRAPVDGFVAESLGEANFLRGSVRSKDGSGFVLDLGDGLSLAVATDHPVDVGKTCTVAIRPEDIELAPALSARSDLVGHVRSIAFAGNTTLYVIEALRREIRVRRPNSAAAENGFALGQEVALAWNSGAALILSDRQGVS